MKIKQSTSTLSTFIFESNKTKVCEITYGSYFGNVFLPDPAGVHHTRRDREGTARVTTRYSSRVGVAWYCEAPSPLLRVCVARGGLQHVCIYVINTTWGYVERHGDAW